MPPANRGMGDNDNTNDINKSFFESKLSNRSLVLIGGGVHSHASREEGSGGTTTTTVIQSASAVGKKRERKRVGGNGMFGSLSARKRKKVLMRRSCSTDKSVSSKDDSGAKSISEVVKQGIERAASSNSNDLSEINKLNNILETLHDMWKEYIAQLLLHIKPELLVFSNQTDKSKSSTSSLDLIRGRSQISALLLEAEHVGMPATIIECPSRHYLLHHRCMVINETVNTWTVLVYLKRKRNKKAKALTSDLRKDKQDDDKEPQDKHPARTWKVIMVPKRGTVLEVNIPIEIENPINVNLRIET